MIGKKTFKKVTRNQSFKNGCKLGEFILVQINHKAPMCHLWEVCAQKVIYFYYKFLFLLNIIWSQGPDLNRHARNERGILSSSDREITLGDTT